MSVPPIVYVLVGGVHAEREAVLLASRLGFGLVHVSGDRYGAQAGQDVQTALDRHHPARPDEDLKIQAALAGMPSATVLMSPLR